MVLRRGFVGSLLNAFVDLGPLERLLQVDVLAVFAAVDHALLVQVALQEWPFPVLLRQVGLGAVGALGQDTPQVFHRVEFDELRLGGLGVLCPLEVPLMALARVDQLQGYVVASQEVLQDSLVAIRQLQARSIPLEHPILQE